MKVCILLISLWFLSFGVQGQEIINTPTDIRLPYGHQYLGIKQQYGVNYSDVFKIDTISGIILSTKDTISLIVTKGYLVRPMLQISYEHYKVEYFDTNWKPISGIILDFSPYKNEE